MDQVRYGIELFIKFTSQGKFICEFVTVGFEELRCYCGLEVLYPPVPCGARPPECHQVCTRSHSCEHEVRHTCHSEETCPPCAALTEKWCMGRHEVRQVSIFSCASAIAERSLSSLSCVCVYVDQNKGTLPRNGISTGKSGFGFTIKN